jgi:hypothetical protein
MSRGFLPIHFTSFQFLALSVSDGAELCLYRSDDRIHAPDDMRSQLAIAVFALAAVSCDASSASTNKLEASYNEKNGKLEVLKYDSDGDGKFDTVSYMDGTRIVRIEIDRDEDGKVDRWEYYGPGQKLEKVGFSRANDGIEDAWSIIDDNGSVARIEIATKRDGKPNRFEYYTDNVLTRVEEDTDGDGRVDKWETYDGQRLASVAFDLRHRGTPDRRLVYGTDGSARMEIDETGTGQFVAMNEAASRTSLRQGSAPRQSVH